MRFRPTEIEDVVFIVPEVFTDERGAFLETWQAAEFRTAGIDRDFVQDNHSVSHHHVLRGLHYQLRQPQGKLVRVVRGAVFDVAVDLRSGSPNFAHWVGRELSAENRHMLWIPEGFAHGFLALCDGTELVYKCTDAYVPEDEHCLLWNDASVAVDWPLAPGHQPVLSDKDRAGRSLEDATCYP